MRQPIRPAVSLVLVAAFLAAPAPSVACCDGFWSCAAAVASLGLTCAAEALLDSIKQMKKDVDDLHTRIAADLKQIADETRGGVHDAGDGMSQAAADAQTRYDKALLLARKAKEDAERKASASRPQNAPAVSLGGVAAGGNIALAPTPRGGGSQAIAGGPALGGSGGSSTGGGGSIRYDQPCTDADALAALRRAAEMLQQDRSAMADQVQKARASAEEANVRASAASDLAKNVAADALLAPLLDLGGMLDDLLRHPEHLFNPGAVVEAGVRRVTDAIAGEFDKLAATITADAGKSIEESRLRAEEAARRAAVAARVGDAADGVQKSQTKVNCDKLSALLPAGNVTLVAHVTASSPGLLEASPRITAALNKVGAGKARATSLSRTIDSTLASHWSAVKSNGQATLRPTPVPGADSSFKVYMDGMFRGLSRSQAVAKKNALLAEARTRYASDPAMAAKMLDLISREADDRLEKVRIPAPDRR